MREFSKISPQFWLGETAKKLRGHQEAQIVAMYLLSSPHANMIGMYYLPKMFISHETGLTLQGASKGLQRCIEAGFCRYDEAKEIVWVVEMANYQIGELKPSDKRSAGAQNEYLKVPDCNHSMAFFDKYSPILHLSTSKGLRRGFDDPRKQEEGEEDRDGKEKGDGDGEAGASAPAAAPVEHEKPEAYIDRITRQDIASHQVTMSPDWKPGSQFPALMLRAGLTADRFTDEILAKFQIYHNGTSRPQNKWEAALVTWCKRENTEKPKPLAAPPVEKKTEYWGRDPKRMMTPSELATLHAGRALLK